MHTLFMKLSKNKLDLGQCTEEAINDSDDEDTSTQDGPSSDHVVEENRGENISDPTEMSESESLREVALFILKSQEESVTPRVAFNNTMTNLMGLKTTKALHNDKAFFGIYKQLNTEYKLKKYCSQHLNLIESQTFILGQETLNGKVVKDTFQYIPIKNTLKEYLKKTKLTNNTSDMDSGYTYSSFCDGLIFQESSFFKYFPNALRLLFYTDEFEVTNPLQSKKGMHKLMPVYFIVDNIDQELKSSLKHIHLCLLTKFKHVKKYGYGTVLKPLYDELKQLEQEGLHIQIDGQVQLLFGTMIGLSSDNLSSHAIGGFSQNFTTGCICRHCLARKSTINSKFKERDFVLRNPTEHAKHVHAATVHPTYAKIYGVQGSCIFNELDHFHVTTGLPPDVMHDLLEGNQIYC